MNPDFSLSAPQLAPLLIGWELRVDDNGGVRGGIITETEAYTADDPASHSYPGVTKRNQPMFKEAGTIYMYRIYGLHTCLNFVCGNKDGQAVLIRALLPTAGLEYMRSKRHTADGQLCNGPAKLVQALGLGMKLNGRAFVSSPLQLLPPQQAPSVQIGTRIGITKARDTMWRFYST